MSVPEHFYLVVGLYRREIVLIQFLINDLIEIPLCMFPNDFEILCVLQELLPANAEATMVLLECQGMQPGRLPRHNILLVFIQKHFIEVVDPVAFTYVLLQLLLRKSLATLNFILHYAVINKKFGPVQYSGPERLQPQLRDHVGNFQLHTLIPANIDRLGVTRGYLFWRLSGGILLFPFRRLLCNNATTHHL